MSKINRSGWNVLGNPGVNDTDNFIGPTTLDVDFKLSVNSSFGGQVDMIVLDAVNAVAGDTAIDLRGAGAVFLSDVIFMKQTMEIVTVENFIVSSVQLLLNNDSGGNIRRFQLATSDSGFGSYQFILGNASQPNELLTGGVFPFRFSSTGLDQDFEFFLNFGGVQTEVMSITAVGSQTLPEVEFHTLIRITDTTPIPFTGTGSFDLMKAGGAGVTGVNISNPVNSVMNTDTNWKYTVQLNALFSSTNGFNGTVSMTPDSPSGGTTDTHAIRSILGSAFFTTGGGRTMNSVQGGLFQAGVQFSGTVTDAIGLASQVLTSSGGVITNAISCQLSAPLNFLGGTIVNGITFISKGGFAGATSNWNAQFQGNLRSYFEGPTSFGGTFNPEFVIDTRFWRVRTDGGQSRAWFGGTGDISTTQVLFRVGGAGLFRIVGENATNNEALDFDLETTANEVALSSSTGADLKLDFPITTGTGKVLYQNKFESGKMDLIAI